MSLPYNLLFGKTSVGKSYYLHHEVLPGLERQGLRPVLWHLGAQGLCATVSERLRAAAAEPAAMEAWLAEMARGRAATLWETVQAYRLSGADSKPLVFVFDSFEAFFHQAPAEQTEFLEAMADLAAGRLPERVQEAFRAIPRRERTERLLAWQEPPGVELLFVVCAEQMDRIEALTGRYPELFRRRQALQAWSREQAAARLQVWAAEAGRSYTDEACMVITKEVADESDQILPLPLHLAHRQLMRTTGQNPINPEDWTRLGGLPGALAAHYLQTLDGLPAPQRASAAHLLEEGLLAGGSPTYLTLETITAGYGLAESLLLSLEEQQLVRSETSSLGTVYRIADEGLAAAIAAEHRLRKEREHRLQLEQARAETRRERSRRLLMTALAALALAAALWAVWQWRRAESLYAEKQEALFGEFYRQGAANHFIKNKYQSAIAHYNNALKIARQNDLYPDSIARIEGIYIPECARLDSLQAGEFNLLFAEAERLHAAPEPDYARSIPKMLQAARLGLNTPKLRSALNARVFDITRYIELHPEQGLQAAMVELYKLFDRFFEERRGWRDVAFGQSKDAHLFDELHEQVRVYLRHFRALGLPQEKRRLH